MPTIAQMIATRLQAAGVQYVFGMPGGEVLDLMAAIEEAGIKFVLIKHETAGVYMAEAIYHLTGKPGAVLATVGPGAANLVLGVANAYLDRSAVIVLTGNMISGQSPPYTHQVLDLDSLFRPITKWSTTLTVLGAAAAIDRAVHMALSGTPGPVHINVPLDVAQQVAVVPANLPFGFTPHEAETILAPAMAEALAQRLAGSKRAVAMVGLGAHRSGAGVALRRFAEAWQIPVITTYKTKGLLPEDHPLSMGGAGLSPVVDGILFPRFAEADLILTIGFDAVETRGTWVNCWPPEKVVRLDTMINTDLVYRGSLEVTGHLPSILAQLADRAPAGRATWNPSAPAMVSTYRRAVADAMQAPGLDHLPGRLSPVRAVQILREEFPRETIAASDTGAHRIMLNHVWESYESPGILQSNGLGSMGPGMPSALAAKLVYPDRPALAMVGDAGLLMFPGELAVAAELGLPIVVAVFSDQALSLIKLKQEKDGRPPVGVDFAGVDFVKLAEAMGGQGVFVRDEAELREAARWALGATRFTVIEIAVDPSEFRRQM